MTSLCKRVTSIAVLLTLTLALLPGIAFAAPFTANLAPGQAVNLRTEMNNSSVEFASNAISAQASSSGETMVNAIPMSLDASVTGSLASRDEECWHKVQIAQPGMLEGYFSSDYSKDRHAWNIRLVDSWNNLLCSKSYETGGTLEQSAWRIGLSAGTYYIVVNDPQLIGASAVGISWRLRTSFLASSAWETEWNDSPEQASSFAVGSAKLGAIRGYVGRAVDDEDWYAMSLSGSQTIQFSLGSEYFDANEHDSLWTGGNWSVTLYDSNLRALASGEADATDKTDQPVFVRQLSSGRYYLKVRDSSYSMGRSTVQVTYRIKAQIQLTSSAVSNINNKVYTGRAITQNPIVNIGGQRLRPNIDYTLSYANNTNAGKATVTVTGKGLYTGSISKTFAIAKANNPLGVSAKSKSIGIKHSKLKKKNQVIAKAKAFKVDGHKGAVTFEKLSGNAKVKVSKAGKITVKKGLKKGTYAVKVRVTARGTSNYKSAAKKVKLTIKVR